jgi:hypothetical protein
MGADAQTLIGVANDSYLNEKEEKDQEEKAADDQHQRDGKKDERTHRKH